MKMKLFLITLSAPLFLNTGNSILAAEAPDLISVFDKVGTAVEMLTPLMESTQKTIKDVKSLTDEAEAQINEIKELYKAAGTEMSQEDEAQLGVLEFSKILQHIFRDKIDLGDALSNMSEVCGIIGKLSDEGVPPEGLKDHPEFQDAFTKLSNIKIEVHLSQEEMMEDEGILGQMARKATELIRPMDAIPTPDDETHPIDPKDIKIDSDMKPSES